MISVPPVFFLEGEVYAGVDDLVRVAKFLVNEGGAQHWMPRDGRAPGLFVRASVQPTAESPIELGKIAARIRSVETVRKDAHLSRSESVDVLRCGVDREKDLQL